jgi:uncharacterized protein YjbJ (UPF0337 family)
MSQKVKGAIQQARGTVKAATGRLTGNISLELEGHADRIVGALRRTLGKLRSRLKRR